MAKTAETICADDRRKKAEFASHDRFSGRVLLLGLQARIEGWEPHVPRCEKKLKDTLDDEIKPQELKKHLILELSKICAWKS